MGFQTTLTPLAQRGIDRKLGVIYGYVVAEEGEFKSGRGKFDQSGLADIVRLARSQPEGIKSNWTHGNPFNDSLGNYLGRAHNFRLDGSTKSTRVVADLHFDKSAFSAPRGNMAGYIMDLAEGDPGALASSLVLRAKQVYDYGKNGKIKMAANGDPAPPLWIPEEIGGSDVVSVGDATSSFLSACASLHLRPLEMPDEYYDNRRDAIAKKMSFE